MLAQLKHLINRYTGKKVYPSKEELEESATMVALSQEDDDLTPLDIYLIGKLMVDFGSNIMAVVKDLAIESYEEQHGREKSTLGNRTVFLSDKYTYDFMPDSIRDNLLSKKEELTNTINEINKTLKQRETILKEEHKALIKNTNTFLTIK